MLWCVSHWNQNKLWCFRERKARGKQVCPKAINDCKATCVHSEAPECHPCLTIWQQEPTTIIQILLSIQYGNVLPDRCMLELAFPAPSLTGKSGINPCSPVWKWPPFVWQYADFSAQNNPFSFQSKMNPFLW